MLPKDYYDQVNHLYRARSVLNDLAEAIKERNGHFNPGSDIQRMVVLTRSLKRDLGDLNEAIDEVLKEAEESVPQAATG